MVVRKEIFWIRRIECDIKKSNIDGLSICYSLDVLIVACTSRKNIIQIKGTRWYRKKKNWPRLLYQSRENNGGEISLINFLVIGC